MSSEVSRGASFVYDIVDVTQDGWKVVVVAYFNSALDTYEAQVAEAETRLATYAPLVSANVA